MKGVLEESDNVLQELQSSLQDYPTHGQLKSCISDVFEYMCFIHNDPGFPQAWADCCDAIVHEQSKELQIMYTCQTVLGVIKKRLQEPNKFENEDFKQVELTFKSLFNQFSEEQNNTLGHVKQMLLCELRVQIALAFLPRPSPRQKNQMPISETAWDTFESYVNEFLSADYLNFTDEDLEDEETGILTATMSKFLDDIQQLRSAFNKKSKKIQVEVFQSVLEEHDIEEFFTLLEKFIRLYHIKVFGYPSILKRKFQSANTHSIDNEQQVLEESLKTTYMKHFKGSQADWKNITNGTHGNIVKDRKNKIQEKEDDEDITESDDNAHQMLKKKQGKTRKESSRVSHHEDVDDRSKQRQTKRSSPTRDTEYIDDRGKQRKTKRSSPTRDTEYIDDRSNSLEKQASRKVKSKFKNQEKAKPSVENSDFVKNIVVFISKKDQECFQKPTRKQRQDTTMDNAFMKHEKSNAEKELGRQLNKMEKRVYQNGGDPLEDALRNGSTSTSSKRKANVDYEHNSLDNSKRLNRQSKKAVEMTYSQMDSDDSDTEIDEKMALIVQTSKLKKRAFPPMEEVIDSLPQKKLKRVKFTKEEEQFVLTGVRVFGTGKWKEILDSYDFHPSRTSVSIKDKYRNIMKREKN